MNRTEEDRAHNLVNTKKEFINNTVCNNCCYGVKGCVIVCEYLVVGKLKDVAVGIRAVGLTGLCDYAIEIDEINGAKGFSGPINNPYQVIELDEIAPGSVLRVSLDTDEEIEKVYVTIISNYYK